MAFFYASSKATKQQSYKKYKQVTILTYAKIFLFFLICTVWQRKCHLKSKNKLGRWFGTYLSWTMNVKNVDKQEQYLGLLINCRKVFLDTIELTTKTTQTRSIILFNNLLYCISSFWNTYKPQKNRRWNYW